MYCISDKQIDFILSDIRARGVEMESLQQSLLDHVCCIVEQNLGENGDFESFYNKTIRTFYKDALWEIEEETISLLTFKNYYTMKKVMIISGVFSAIAMTMGIVFKFMHWPGAGPCIVLGIGSASLVFLPLMFTLKAREKQSVKDRLVIGIGALVAILISLSILFKVMHWPYANIMGNVALALMLLLFLPVYFFTGVRNPDTRVNTVASSVVIILGCGLLLTLMRTPRSSHMMNVKNTYDFVRSQQILKTEQRQVEAQLLRDSIRPASAALAAKITQLCEDLKSYVLEYETGYRIIDENFENENRVLEEHTFGGNPFLENQETAAKVETLCSLIEEYNTTLPAKTGGGIRKISTASSFVQYYNRHEYGIFTVYTLLNQLTQIQMFVLQNERELLAVK